MKWAVLLQRAGLLLALPLSSTATTLYVDINNAAPAAPYTAWATAATNIQDAVDAAVSGDVVLVTNGVYQSGGRAVYGTLTNRVAVTSAITLRSVNGPAVTVIQGVPGVGDGGARCVYLTNGALISGFTLANGGTRGTGNDGQEQSGGAVWGESTSAVASNCVITSSSSGRWGGGAAFLTLLNCVVTGNYSGHGGGVFMCALTNCVVTNNSSYFGGGARDSTLDHCTVNGNVAYEVGGGTAGGTLTRCGLTNNSSSRYAAGGAYGGTLEGCILVGNSAGTGGGGASDSTLNNCMLVGNSGSSGGGAAFSTLINCVLAANSCGSAGGAAWYCGLYNCTVTGNAAGVGGGTESSSLYNCIMVYNTANTGPNYANSTLNYCCTTPWPNGGAGNLVADPLLTDLAHISAASPCRGAGSAAYASGADIDGQGWGGPPSIGCDEYYPGTVPGLLSVSVRAAYTNMAVGFGAGFLAQVNGQAAANRWEFGDGMIASNRLSVTHAWAAVGDYAVVFSAVNDSNPGGVSATVMVHVVTQPVHYVSAGSATPVPPYASWGTAATNIQDAVDAAGVSGALVLVTNGTYQTGARVVSGWLPNRVVVAQGLTVQSVNGPAVTIIQGSRSPAATNGDGAVRCAYVSDSAVLSGFTLTLGATLNTGDSLNDQSGGGVRCETTAVVSNCVLSTNAANSAGGGASGGTLSHCVLVGNTSAGSGGGAYDCTLDHCTLTGCSANDGGGVNACGLNNCALTSNSAASGGGASSCTLNGCSLYGNSAVTEGGGARGCTASHCTITGNSAPIGGGASSCTLNNSILFYNTGNVGANHSGSTLNYCCTTPLPLAGSGNFMATPRLADFSHLSAGSPCRAAGVAAYGEGSDIDDERWVNPAAIGCDEYVAGAITGPLLVAVHADNTNVAAGFMVQLTGVVTGHASSNRWDFGDGSTADNQPYSAHSWAAAGDYLVVFSAYNEANPGGVNATAAVHVVTQPVHYVAVGSASPASPYTSWEIAAAQIQDAVDAVSVAGAVVLVTNGTYQSGGRVAAGALTNRVVVNKPMLVRSVNGPDQTVIKANPVVGDGAVRCVYLAKGAVLSGFTLTNGASRNGGDMVSEQSGGGVWCEPIGVVVSNCVLVGNSAAWYGGGAFAGSFYDCVLSANAGYVGGAAYASALDHCTLGGKAAGTGGGAQNCSLNACTLTNNHGGSFGGGAYASTLTGCILQGNHAGSGGGGACDSTLDNCLLSGNSSSEEGGGATESTLNNCTIVTNSRGVDYCTLNNCISYYNIYSDYSLSTLSYCCTAVLPDGPGNSTNAPLFLDLAAGDFRLQPGSPGINAGYNALTPVGHDLDGNPRIVGGTVDVGAYECQSPAWLAFYLWLQGYGLPTAASAAYTDSDRDGMNNWQEWAAGTNPTNAGSGLVLAAPLAGAGSVTLTWASVINRSYYVERATNLLGQPAFYVVRSNIPGLPGTTSCTDASPPDPGPAYYRVGVRP